MHATIEEAMTALREAEMDVEADMGRDAVEAAYADIVHSVADNCDTEDVAKELRRRTLGDPS